MLTGNIKSKIDSIWNAFWTGGISNPLTVIEQFTYLLFIRRLDEMQHKKEKQASFTGKPITDPIYTEQYQGFRWSKLKQLDPETIFERFTKPSINEMTVFDHMKTVGLQGGAFSEYMKGATFMIGTSRLLDQVVQQLDAIEMDDRDTKGDIYEYMLSKIASSGQNGQFRTPRHIIKLMVEMLELRKDDVICDPSAGTAGFLVAAGEHYAKEHKDWFNEKEFREHYNSNMFMGIEFDSTMMRIGSMNLQLHGITSPKLYLRDSLSEANADLNECCSVILANPPFKGSVDHNAVDPSITNVVKSKKTELLFLGLMLRMLKVGGRAAVIVPDGVLFGSSKAHKEIRQEIVEKQKLNAVISMPSGVFKPYAGVSTAVIIFTKTNSGGTDDVWFYDMKADGYSLDDKRAEIKDNDLPDIIERYKNMAADNGAAERSRSRTDQSFLVPFDDIKGNDWDLSINRYKEIEYEEINYAPPKDIITDIETLDKERNEALATLKGLLG